MVETARPVIVNGGVEPMHGKKSLQRQARPRRRIHEIHLESREAEASHVNCHSPRDVCSENACRLCTGVVRGVG